MNAAIYARYSSSEQAGTLTIESQTRACKEYALSNGMRLVETYVDRGISGSRDQSRPDAALKAGLTPYTYGRIERNEVTPKLDQVTKIFAAFGLSMGRITEETSKPEKLTIRDCLNNIEYYTKELRRLVGQ